MPSYSLLRWRADRVPRLNALEAQAAVGPPSTLTDENLRALVAMLSAHFQGFCRDLYTEAAQRVVLAAPLPFQPFVQRQAMAELKLSTGNPTLQAVTLDFNRLVGDLRTPLDANPANASRVNHLAELIRWRNHVVHHGAVAPPGTPLSVPLAGTWLAACDGLAAELDRIVYDALTALPGSAPW